jgi:superfamily II DNA or RNA helicase
MKAIISNWYYLPKRYLTPDGLANLKSSLIIRPEKGFISENPYAPKPPDKIIRFYREMKSYIGIPIDYGIKTFPELPYEDRTSLGEELYAPKRADPYHPKAHKGQPKYIADLKKACDTYFTVQARADTGTGKTVSSLNVAADLGRKTLVVVHLERLAHQWREEAIEHLGMQEDQVGLICTDHNSWDRPIVISIVNSLIARNYPKEVLDSFGTVIYDESHKYGSYYFSKCIGMFKASYKISQSATTDRKDDTDRVAKYYFGNTRVELDGDALPTRLYKVYYDDGFYDGLKHWVRRDLINALESDTKRNAYLARLTHLTYRQGHYTLVMVEGIDHAEELIKLMIQLGIPANEIGQYTGSKNVYNSFTGETTRKKNKVQDLKYILLNKAIRIRVATYSMITEGIDVPWLTCGIDAIARSDKNSFKQLMGRVRRISDNKEYAVWLSLIDKAIPRSESNFDDKVKELERHGVTVKTFSGGKL